MRILHLTNLYAPVIGGLERAVATLAEAFTARGHEVTVLTLATSAAPDDETINGVRVRRVRSLGGTYFPQIYGDPARPFHPTAADPMVTAGIRRELATGRYDLVHSHDWAMYSYLPLRRTKYGLPHVHSAHDYALACAKKTLVYAGGGACPGPRLDRCLKCSSAQYGPVKAAALTLGLASHAHHGIDRLLATSTAVATALEQARKPGRLRPIVLPAAVPDGIEEPGGRTPDFVPREPFLMFAGALGTHKGLDVLFDAYGKLVAGWTGPAAPPTLLCLGMRRADTPPVPDGVRIVENVPHAEVMAAWRAASVAVVPSSWSEPLGLVAVEALLAGTPTVATAVGGLVDVIRHEETGLLVSPNDPSALAAAVRRLFDDPALAARLAANGRSHARQFTAGAVAPRLEEIYRSLL